MSAETAKTKFVYCHPISVTLVRIYFVTRKERVYGITIADLSGSKVRPNESVKAPIMVGLNISLD